MDIEKYYDKIYRYCYYKVNSKTLAEDLTQETFLRYIGSLQEARESERYLYTIARNLCIDEYKRRKETELPDEDIDDGSDFENKTLERIRLEEAMKMLSDDESEILQLRLLNEEPYSEICKIMGISRFAAHRKLETAKKKLKSYLEKGEIV
ncbi:MAG: sigma-70 family RNA polymerase sigma factor [Butyrivibrio sp.]|nr:sigma-70 family RNA polymerase sigma factor [Butyrivibrio sp.]